MLWIKLNAKTKTDNQLIIVDCYVLCVINMNGVVIGTSSREWNQLFPWRPSNPRSLPFLCEFYGSISWRLCNMSQIIPVSSIAEGSICAVLTIAHLIVPRLIDIEDDGSIAGDGWIAQGVTPRSTLWNTTRTPWIDLTCFRSLIPFLVANTYCRDSNQRCKGRLRVCIFPRGRGSIQVVRPFVGEGSWWCRLEVWSHELIIFRVDYRLA